MQIYPTRATKRRGKYAAEVGYRGYVPTYRTICNISYGECATDEPFCVRRPHIFEKASSLYLEVDM